MPQIHNLPPLIKAAAVSLLPVALGATLLSHYWDGGAAPSARTAAHLGAQLRLASPAASKSPQPLAPHQEPPAVPSPAKGAGLPPPAAGDSAHPYPMDALGQVAQGQLSLSWSGAAGATTGQLVITIPQGGWIPGQPVSLFVGHQFEVTAPGPGSTVVVRVTPPAPGSPRVTVTGFQFPGNDPSAPIQAFGSAPLPGAP